MKKAFTLIELLVVIAIIAILAAILFPVFTQAKAAAKKTADLSNCKQLAIGIELYINDSDDVYPPSNHRENDNSDFETHWSWMVLPYLKSEKIFVSPADKIGGWAPTSWNAINNNRGFGVPSYQVNLGRAANPGTKQVGRISYIANQSLIGRKRETTDTSNVVSQGNVNDVSGTILIAPATEAPYCMNSSYSGNAANPGGEFKTYRPAFGITTRGQRPLSGSSAPPPGEQPLEAMTWAMATRVWGCETGAAIPDHTLRYTNSGRFDKGNNYVMGDTSAKYRVTASTFDVKRWAWGKQGYSVGGLTVVDPATGLALE
ncbi:MAG: prepilin-type N-terminal cleavage/methylation domain-containing protein [Armatimonadetes bacterium]|nr:prepilin-type N-terminal cleavage/methylation domain-containing protein [Armatimonadota bacterium]